MAKAKKKKDSPVVKSSKSVKWVTMWGVGCFVLALVSGLLNKWHVETMFENDKHFSHLGEQSDHFMEQHSLGSMERDMAFRTEMGLYYSYYQSMVDAPTWQQVSSCEFKSDD